MVSIKDFFMQEAYIVAGFRTAVTKSKKGGFRFMRSDELAIELIQGLMKSLPALEHKLIDDVIVGNAVPEAEQGLQFGRIIAAKALGIEVPGITINRYCASGLESIAMATAKSERVWQIVSLQVEQNPCQWCQLQVGKQFQLIPLQKTNQIIIYQWV